MDDNLSKALKELALNVKRIVDEGVSKGEIKPDEELFFRWKVDKFKYTDEGVTESGVHGKYVIKDSWIRTIVKLIENIKKSNGYKYVLEQLTHTFGKEKESTLDYFVGKIIRECLQNPRFDEPDIDVLIQIFLKDLNGEPVRYGAKVELIGIILRPDSVKLTHGITLRRTKIEDLEKEFPAYGIIRPSFFPIPSAILNIEFLGRGVNEIQRKIEQSIVILRLFKVGSVKWTRYYMYSDSITDITAGGISTSGGIKTALEKYLVTEEDVSKLKKFWKTIGDVLPRSLFEAGMPKTDYITIAYNRYSDSLFQNGVLERRIANVVMGLEALYLKSGEVQELVYRLSYRMGKLLSLLGYDPYEVIKIVRDAYNIRNIFAHGGHLSYKRKKKLESKYKDIKYFLLRLLEYLRVSIILMLLSKKEKDELIDLIDDSFIDGNMEEMLNNMVSQYKDIL